VSDHDPAAHRALTARLRAAGSVFAEDEATVILDEADGDAVRLRTLLNRRVAGEPLEVVVGWAMFCGHRVRVVPGVFVPRRRTELVVELAAARLQVGDSVVDLCCGVGAIGVGLLATVGRLDLVAVDIDPDAVDVAAENLAGKAVAVQGDLFAPLPDRLRGAVDVVAVNAPYVPTDAIALMPPEARDHERSVALDGGADGLDVHRRIAAQVGGWLRPGGAVVIEVSAEQADPSAALFTAAGLEARVEHDADRDATAVVAVAPAPAA
jgi:release factor glutamine methyltransferase